MIFDKGHIGLFNDNMGIDPYVLEVEEFNSAVKNDLRGRLTSEAKFFGLDV